MVWRDPPRWPLGEDEVALEEHELEALFAPYGQVSAVRIITDRYTGQSRGFGFVEMGNSDEASAAISALNNAELGGRALRINFAEDKPRHRPECTTSR